MKAVDYKIIGTKCDNPSCDFKDNSVKLEDYPLWLNRPCPKCGQSLLTKEDLETIKIIICIVNIINWVTKPFSFLFKNEKPKNYSVEMNGTGSVNFKRID